MRILKILIPMVVIIILAIVLGFSVFFRSCGCGDDAKREQTNANRTNVR